MVTSYEINDTFNCSLERAFKTPILGDARKFLNGYLFQPGVMAFEEDSTWGHEGGTRIPITNGNFLVKKGRLLMDKVLHRSENKYWKWTVYDFNTWTLFFASKAIGEWWVKEIEANKIRVTYKYTYHSSHFLFHPFTILIVQIQIRGLMKQAMKGIKLQAENNADYIYH